MEVLRNGKVIGFSKYYFNYKDQFLEVKNETKFEVKLAGVKIFEIKSKIADNTITKTAILAPDKPFV